MKTEHALLAACFISGLVMGSLFLPLPRYKSNGPGISLDTWTGQMDTYGAQRKRFEQFLTPEPSNSTNSN
jgi:hypothetical protein